MAGWVETLVAVGACLAVAGGPVLVLRRCGAAWGWFGLGIASWALALAVKIPAAVALHYAGLSAATEGTLSGVVSAACELGFAALFLRRRTLSGANVLAFGVGIGAFEVLFVLGLAGLEATAGEADPAPMAAGVAWLFLVLERAISLVGHAASRVLVYVALRARWLLPAVVAVTVFACVDGVASYGTTAGWDWDRVDVRGLFTLFIAVAGALEAAVAWWAWRTRGAARAPEPPPGL
ncbi:MAG: hypothetical protein ACYTEZ_18335 [Planctomycetota bacterium]|jgi:hypothetical protein